MCPEVSPFQRLSEEPQFLGYAYSLCSLYYLRACLRELGIFLEYSRKNLLKRYLYQSMLRHIVVSLFVLTKSSHQKPLSNTGWRSRAGTLLFNLSNSWLAHTRLSKNIVIYKLLQTLILSDASYPVRMNKSGRIYLQGKLRIFKGLGCSSVKAQIFSAVLPVLLCTQNRQ